MIEHLARAVYLPVVAGARVAYESDEVLLPTRFGGVLLVAGSAQKLHVSSVAGACLMGVASGLIAESAHRLLARALARSLCGHVFLGLQINPGSPPPVALVAAGLGVVTARTKVATGYWASARAGIGHAGCRRAGLTLVARGEFSIVILLGAAIEPHLGRPAATSTPF